MKIVLKILILKVEELERDIKILEDKLKIFSSTQISFKKIKGALHEPFCGSTREDFLMHLNRWIDHKLG